MGSNIPTTLLQCGQFRKLETFYYTLYRYNSKFSMPNLFQPGFRIELPRNESIIYFQLCILNYNQIYSVYLNLKNALIVRHVHYEKYIQLLSMPPLFVQPMQPLDACRQRMEHSYNQYEEIHHRCLRHKWYLQQEWSQQNLSLVFVASRYLWILHVYSCTFHLMLKCSIHRPQDFQLAMYSIKPHHTKS